MRVLFLVYSVVLVPVCLQQETSPIAIHQPGFPPEVAVGSVNHGIPLSRKERKVFDLKLGSGLGFKQTALNLIFAKINQAAAVATSKVGQLNRLNVSQNRALGFAVPCSSCESGRGAVTQPAASTTEAVPQFDRRSVQLELPGELLNRALKITTNISRVIDSVFKNIADRKQQLVEAAKPYVAAKLGLDIRASSFTTTEPIELLVPRLGPPLGAESPNTSPPSPEEDGSANRTGRSVRPAS